MAERKAVNKYYPPDWDPSKGSINKHVGQHPLRERAKKLSQGILVIRFEMPYNIWCGGCNSHIGMGVRYNAEKSKTGNYYSTPIYKFRMKCHLCPNYFEIQTDPKNHDYVILSGARRKEQRWDPKENEQIVPEDKRTQKKLATDAMYKLEHGSDDNQRGRSGHVSLSQIEGRREEWRDDYILNKIVREKFREEKKAMKEAASADQALLDKSSLDIELVEEEDHDRKMAGLIKYSVTESFDEKQKLKRKAIENRPLFDSAGPKSAKMDTSPLLSRSAEIQKKLGLNLLGGKKNPFDVAVAKGSPSNVPVVVRKKSSDDSENSTTNPSLKITGNGSENANVNPSLKLTGNGSENSTINPGISGKAESSPHEESVISNCDTRKPNAMKCDANSSESSEDLSKLRNDTAMCDANGDSSQNKTHNALGTLMSNYSDSDDSSS